jgi:hypothetical protein
MQSITFAVPALATAQMTRQDQIDILVNQATAAIVCCYLEHMNAAITKGITGATTTGAVPIPGTASSTTAGATAFLTTTELVGLINDVQGALRTIP